MADTAAPAASETTTSQAPAEAPAPTGWVGQFKEAFEKINAPAPTEEGAAQPEPAKAEEPKAKPAAKEAKASKAAQGLTAEELKKREASIKDAQERRKIAQERDQLAEQLKGYQEAERIRKSAKDDPWGALKWLGLKPEELTAALADKGPMTEERKALLEMQQWRQQREQAEEQARQQALMQQGRAKIAEFLGSDERFEITRANPSGVDTVLAVMNQHWEATRDPVTGQGEYMKPEEAAQIVESYFESELDKLTQLSKVKKKLGVAEPSKPSTTPAPRQPRTISSKMSATTAPPPAEQSDEDRKRWFAEELKKHFGA